MKHKGTVLILAYECYPYNRAGSAIGAQRPYQFAKNLAELGWKVIVLCCDHDKRRTLSKDKLKSVSIELYATYQEKINHDDYCILPLPSLSSYGWADYLWSVCVNPAPGGAYKAKGFPYSIIRKFATLYNQLFNGDYSWSWTPVVESFTKQLVTQHKIDVIIGEHSPDAGILLANKFSQKYSIPWIADFRDPILWPFKGLFGWTYKQVVKKILQSATATINVNPYWTQLDSELFRKPAYTIVNGYDKPFFDQVPAHLFPFFSISYFGSFSAEFQDVVPSLKAFAEFLKRSNYPVDARLFYRGLQQQEFIAQCEAAGVSTDYRDVDGFVKREETVAFMKGSALLLLYAIPSYKATDRYKKKGFYPGKVFEYMGTGKPVLCIPSDHALLESLVQSMKMGKATSSLEEAVVFIQQEYKNWREKKETKSLPVEGFENYTRQKQALELESILMKIIYSRSTLS